MQHDDGKSEIRKILGGHVRFEGHFNMCFDNIKETQQQGLIEWVRKCRDKEIGPLQSKKDRALIGFVERFGSNLRAILTKEKKGYFVALFLDKHKYYEIERRKLGI